MPTRYRKVSNKKGKHQKGRLKTKKIIKKNTRKSGSGKARKSRKRRGGMMGTRDQVLRGLVESTNFGSAIKTYMPNLRERCNTLEDYTTLRNALKEYGVERFHKTETKDGKKLFSGDYLNIKGSPSPEPENGRIPFTFFSVMKGANEEDQKLIPIQLRDKYIILRNIPELGGSPGTDFSNAPKIDKKLEDAAMSQHHQFVGVKAMDWDKFNALTFGYGKGGVDEALLMLDELEEIANIWAVARDIPPQYLGCYFHIYPFNSVQSLHMHMVDTRHNSRNDPSWDKQTPKNMPLEMVRRYLTTINPGNNPGGL